MHLGVAGTGRIVNPEVKRLLLIVRHPFTTRHGGEPGLRDVIAAGEAATIKSWH
jgi:hypothetical protein